MRHPFHLVEPSPWPIFIAFNLLFFLIGFVSLLNGYLLAIYTYLFSFSMVLLVFSLWLYDIITESLYLGSHSYKTLRSLVLGFLFFLLTEVMLFFSLFWAYFHSALNPTFLIWPPIGISLVNPWAIPLLNTFLLLFSGVAITYSHHSFISYQRHNTIVWLSLGIILGIIFFILQVLEYFSSSFDITDSVYGSAFFMLTGGHGLHVIVGMIFLSVVLFRLVSYSNPNIIFDLAVLYWHLVDVVWIFLYVLIYYMAY